MFTGAYISNNFISVAGMAALSMIVIITIAATVVVWTKDFIRTALNEVSNVRYKTQTYLSVNMYVHM